MLEHFGSGTNGSSPLPLEGNGSMPAFVERFLQPIARIAGAGLEFEPAQR